MALTKFDRMVTGELAPGDPSLFMNGDGEFSTPAGTVPGLTDALSHVGQLIWGDSMGNVTWSENPGALQAVVSIIPGDPAVIFIGLRSTMIEGGIVDNIQHFTANSAIQLIPSSIIMDNPDTPINLTLPTPVAGPLLTGHDGTVIKITAVDSASHVVTTPGGNIINGSKDTITANGTGTSITLQAFNGKWYTLVNNGMILSSSIPP